MKNPWIRKNPLLSMWLSGANAVAGAARGRMLAESRRQTQTMMNEGGKQAAAFWSGALTVPSPTKKRKRKAR